MAKKSEMQILDRAQQQNRLTTLVKSFTETFE